jgi:hypothetical protein
MANETPADTIRRAAALMRQRATRATTGPWHVGSDVSHGFQVLADDGTGIAWTGEDDNGGGQADAEHIVACHPLVMLAIAESWFQCGEDMAVLHATEIRLGIISALSDWNGQANAAWTATLAAALAYLGEAA